MAFLNDPQGGRQQQNLMTAVLLIFGALLVWQAFQTPKAPPESSESQKQAAQEQQQEAENGGDANKKTAESSDSNASDSNASGDSAEVLETEEILQPQLMKTEHLRLAFTNVGARPVNAAITSPEQYIPRKDELEIFPQLTPCNGEDAAENPSYDCAAAKSGLKGKKLQQSLQLKGFDKLRHDAVYAFNKEKSTCSSDGCKKLVYEWTSPDGSILVRRTYEPVEDKPFALHASVTVENTGKGDRVFDALKLTNYSTYEEKSGGLLSMFNRSANVVEGICHAEDDSETEPARKLNETFEYGKKIAYGGFNEQYFLNVVGFYDPETGDVVYADHCEYAQTEDRPEEWLYSSISTKPFSVKAGESESVHYTWYVGPKRFEYLDQYSQKFSDSVEYGIFTFISVPIRYVLIFLHGLVGNWGVAIILLTLLIKLLLLPITTKAYKSMEAMKRIQPKMEKLKKKYENDQQKLAEEQMKMFREEGVNPLGGCLPLLLQMPVYFALYRTIWGSAELYKAPFFGWIQDLSQPDPYYILPVVLGVMMFGQQKLMPSTSSNQQMKMMQYIMPVMFIPIMLFLPSGLVLYIFCNMVLTILQQLFIRKRYTTDEKA